MSYKNNKNRIGPWISKILRHDPEGIKMTKDGYVLVSDLLSHIGITKQELDDIVRDNDKKRFAYSEDGTMIRASQGHSLGIELNLPVARPPQKLYHGTDSTAYAKILKSGSIKKMKRDHLHLSADVETAKKVGLRHARSIYDLVILEINSAAMYATGYKFYLSANGVWLTESIPTEFIKEINT